ncbi:MAG: LacI family DNA-binding transcriptional regulator [Gloeobacteraceae cyanobacterium ES-bin-144]|nr:LacI family DNA-binding transcriptional regulator [Verrucomicrobiales bacterium]
MAENSITQKQIASSLGLSRMAVSLALKDSPRVSAVTRELVQAEAERLGYRPDPALSALIRYRKSGGSSGYRETLAFVTHWKNPDGWREQYVRRFFDGAQRAAGLAGYHLEPFWLGEYRKPEMASSVLKSRGIRGVLLAPLEQPGTVSLNWENFASVAVGTTITAPALDRVRHDYENSIRLTLAELHALGYQRIALVLPPRVDRITEQRVIDSFHGVVQRTPQLRHSLVCQPTAETKTAFLKEIRRMKPDCVISLQEQHHEWLSSGGYLVPDEIGFAHLHVKDAKHGRSGIDYGAEEIGGTAADRLDILLQRNMLGLPGRPITILIPGRWTVGNTLRKEA